MADLNSSVDSSAPAEDGDTDSKKVPLIRKAETLSSLDTADEQAKVTAKVKAAAAKAQTCCPDRFRER